MTLLPKPFFSLLSLLTVIAMANAAPSSFDFKDPKGVNSVAIVMQSQLEPIMGIAAGVSGELSYDPADPEATSGTITVDANTLSLANSRMTEHAKGDGWINVAENPDITFAFKKVTKVEKIGENTNKLTVVGDFSIAGVTKEITAPVMVSYQEGKASERMGSLNGDLLIVRSTFIVKRQDFGLKPEYDNTKVATDVEVNVGITGYAPAK